MVVEQTSILSYKALTPEEIVNRHEKILAVLREYGSLTNREISKIARMPINCVTPRVKELRDIGSIIPDGIIFDVETHRHVRKWRALA